ncbi:SURF1 family cytochrome oxidase biogenesis protein [Streptomyces iconiensis]|uniref:SURF1-like protein n=1 Tax=Streptomyces iconiensis TaxID=1384038 RepID=A0ABT6ZVG7_9ACTN|nr:SURF1 family protein [Streptomyces iconiensis]MDJ1133049.1 SURF1 family protein [Streptomyces iconiensis]
MYRFLLTRQWVFLTLLGVVLIPTMIKLGFWQLHRHESRVARNEEVSASLSAPTVPVTELTGKGRAPGDDDKFRSVTASGTYDEKHEVVVRHRTAADGDTIGYFVVTPLIQKDGSALLVNRGWIESDRDLTSFPKVPAAPEGKVKVTGRLMPDETTEASGIKDTKGLPDRQVMLINSKQQAKALGRPVYSGFVQLTKTSPKPHGRQPEALPEPDHDGIGPHMAYAVQWWLFTGAVPVGWVFLVRREVAERAADAAKAAKEAKDAPTEPPAGTDAAAGPEAESGAGAEAASPETAPPSKAAADSQAPADPETSGEASEEAGETAGRAAEPVSD